MLRKKRFDHDVCGVSPEAGSESVVGKIMKEVGFKPAVK